MNEVHRFPLLYRKGFTGKIQTWEIWVEGNKILSESGYAGGKLQEAIDVVHGGKNIGQVNETTPHEQAVSEAQSRYQKKIDKGYVTSLEMAELGKTELEGGFFPMLATNYEAMGKKIEFPCFVQPKLDGLRAVLDGRTLFSRSRKPFRDFPLILDLIEDRNLSEYKLDGELYCHALKDDFEEIVGAIKRENSDHPALNQIEFHVFDINIPEMPFAMRAGLLSTLIDVTMLKVKLVETRMVHSHAEIDLMRERYLNLGYEGVMIRNMHGEYVSSASRRSPDLQKYKKMQDAEFKVVGITEGRGKLQGHVGAFICQCGEETFEVKLEGKLDFLRECFENHSLWSGKWLTVRYQSLTNKKRVPRFPVGLRLREVE